MRDALLRMAIDDPVGLSVVCGEALALNPMYLDKFCYSFGRNLFNTCRICDRIDYLYANPKRQPVRDTRIFEQAVKWGCHNGVVWLADESGSYEHMNLAFFHHLSADSTFPLSGLYSIRMYGSNPMQFFGTSAPSFSDVIGRTQETEIPNHLTGKPVQTTYHNMFTGEAQFWNFHRDGTCDSDRSDGFLNIPVTRAVTSLISWTTNMLGFPA